MRAKTHQLYYNKRNLLNRMWLDLEKNLVSLEWLREHLQDDQVKIVDCRFTLGSPQAGVTAYQQGHLPGAVYFDLEKDMSGTKQVHGGRHPMPDWEAFVDKLGKAGINEKVKIVAYDDQGGAMASRFWWLLQFLGHKQVYVLNGGYPHWVSQGYPTTSEAPESVATVFQPEFQHHMLVGIEEVKARKEQAEVVLIDSREEKRYRGLEEQIDPVAGHIPGALNYFWKDILNEDGTWKGTEQLRERFTGVNPAKEVIVYCGSGVTACPNILALKEAGYENVKLYAGSWSDWCSYQDNPVAVDKE